MPQAKHTPGPWVADGVCINGPDGMIGECGFGLRGDPEMQANARLMAAAPDLLAACERAKECLDKFGLDWLGKGPDPLEAAIAKAKGRGA
jgi:hypothetical protein